MAGAVGDLLRPPGLEVQQAALRRGGLEEGGQRLVDLEPLGGGAAQGVEAGHRLVGAEQVEGEILQRLERLIADEDPQPGLGEVEGAVA